MGTAILAEGYQIVNLYFANTNHGALGESFMDGWRIILSLHLTGGNLKRGYVSFELLSPGGDSYRAKYSDANKTKLDALIFDSIVTFCECEDRVLAESFRQTCSFALHEGDDTG